MIEYSESKHVENGHFSPLLRNLKLNRPLIHERRSMKVGTLVLHGTLVCPTKFCCNRFRDLGTAQLHVFTVRGQKRQKWPPAERGTVWRLKSALSSHGAKLTIANFPSFKARMMTSLSMSYVICSYTDHHIPSLSSGAVQRPYMCHFGASPSHHIP